MSDHRQQPDDGRGHDLAVEEARPKVKQPPLYRVVLINDDYTPMEFVVQVLETFFNMDRERATRVMLAVHTKGKGVCGIYTRDIAETKAIKTVFGQTAYRIPVTATKSMTGHTIGAAGAIEAVVSCLSIRHQKIPPTINYENPDSDCDLDYVPNVARRQPVTYALTNSFGFGGTNGCLLLKAYHHN